MTEEQTTAIRTPDQRLRVFVSSTLVELADERVAVGRAITSIGLTPVMFELGARPHPPRELYRAYLAQSDIFIGLYWQRYGWIGPDMDISGLEDEFRLSGGIPRLLYLKSPAPEQEPRLAAMIGELQAEGEDSYRSFRSPRELGRLVRDDLALLLSERFAAGVASASAPATAATATGRSAEAERAPTSSMPVPSTSLIGRDADVDAVADLLAQPDVHLVTITGPGGVGKTRLSIAAARRLGDRIAPSVAFVPLDSITEPDLVLPRIAAAVDAPIEGSRPVLDALAEHLAEAPALLVLDNLEQIADAASQIDDLLMASPGTKILVTSRTALRLRAEREYAVDPLALPIDVEHADIERLAASPAVQLFVDRARAVRYDFELTADNAAAIVEICRRLDGLPLAIELAAARTRLLDPNALLDRLGRSLDALGSGPVDLPERQRTIRSTVAWSIGLLDDEQRGLLAVLSVFADGWTLDAAVAVAAIDEDRALELLDVLAGSSLVRVDATDAGPRFRMLVSVRELAAEELASSSKADEVARRHAEFFGGMVERADWPAERQAEWAERLRVEEENLRVAIRWFLAHDIAPLPHIFHTLWLFWQMRDRMPEGNAWIDQLRLRADELDERCQLELLLTSAFTAVEVGDDERALEAGGQIQELDGRIDDPYLRDVASLALSWILPIQDDLEGALRHASAALAGFRDRDEPFMAFAVLTVGILELALGRDAEAKACLSEVDELGGRFGNSWLESAARTQLVTLAVSAGDLDEARRLLRGSVTPTDDAQVSTLSVTFALLAAARLAMAEGDGRRAAMALGAIDGLRPRAGLRAWPTTRRGEAAVRTMVAEGVDPDVYAEAFSAGSRLSRRDAIDLLGDA